MPQDQENGSISGLPRKCRQQTVAAFKTSPFKVGSGPNGEPVLTMIIGKTGTISFLLPVDMPGQLSETLQKLAN